VYVCVCERECAAMSKYEPLKAFLSRLDTKVAPMSFQEIEGIIGAPLPPAAYKYRAWWSNNRSNSVITHAWLDAGYKTERVDMTLRKLTFRRASDDAPGSSEGAAGGAGVLARLRRALAGTVHVPEGADLTAPTGEMWDAERQ
jgi:hypothetical protein